MEPEVLSRIIQALDIIHSPFASNEIRLEAQQYCNSIKDHPNAPIFGHFLALKENGQSDVVRHFGLQLLENTIRYKWIDGIYNDSEREQIKQAIISLTQKGTHDILIEKQFIKEKVAKLFADVARREWPTRWTDMNNLLQNLYTSSPTTQELTLMIFQYLGKESDLRDSLTCIIASNNILREKYPDGVKKDSPSSRKDEITIMQGETDSEGWLMLWVKSLEQLLVEWQCQSASSVIYEKLIIATLSTIAIYVEWIIARSIAETNVLLVSCKNLLSGCHEIRMIAIECITAIFSRTFQTPEDRALVFNPIYEQDGMELLFLSFKMVQPSQDLLLEENDYAYLKRYVEAIVEFGDKHICFKNNTVIPKQFPKYLELIYEISKHPSNFIASMAIMFWQSAIHHPHISKTFKEQDQLLLMLLELFAERLKILFQKDDDNKTTQYIDMDFDSSSEYKIFAMAFRTKLVETIKLITQMRPIESFNWMVNRIQKTLNISPGKEDLDGDGACKVDSPVYIIFDAELTLMDSIVIGVGKLIKSNEGHDINYAKIIDGMNSLLHMLLNLNYPDVIMSNRYLASMLSFVDMLNMDSRLLFQVLQKIFQFAIFRPPGFTISPTSSFPQPVYRLRCGAIAILIKFGTSMPDVLMNIYNDIAGYVNNIIDVGNNLVTRKEKMSFKKFLLCIIYYSKIPLEQKKALFDPIILPIMNKWLSPDITRFITSITQFRDVSGLNFLSSIIINMKQKGIYKTSSEISKEFHESIMGYESARYNLSLLVETVITFLVKAPESASKQGIPSSEYSGLWEQYVSTILSATLALIRIIHQLWNVESWKEYPEELREVLRLSKEDKASIVGRSLNIPTTKISNGKSYTIASMLDQIHKWLSTLRTESYNVLGRLSAFGLTFYSIPNVHESIVQSLFENAESINNIHWKMLLNILFVRPYVLKCPTPEVLSGFFPQLLKYLDKKLVLEWRILVEKGIQISTPEKAQLLQDNLDTNSDISDEILSEQVLRDLTRAYIDIFDQIFLSVPKKQATGDNTPSIFENNALKEYILCHLLTFKDTVSCTRTTQLCARILPNLIKHEGLRVFVGTSLLTAALQDETSPQSEFREALHDGYHKESHPTIISFITDLYVDLRPLSSAPYETFAQLLNMDHVQLQKFETSLSQASEGKVRKKKIKEFLEGITGLSTEEWFKIPDTAPVNSTRRVVAGVYSKPEIGVLDVVEDPYDVGIIDLFD
ncbi:armadillo-type protein [Gigaspora rosea]|uniref:Armadillo-type protein n=1 Tax=Gigaspora rosea TaxID=44941 RepID=A0A397V8F0_9GLOM|nr:armadillo-type protein [Gigaspora rosea]